MAMITPSRDVSAAGRNFQGGVMYSVDDDTAAAIEAALAEAADETEAAEAAEAPAEPEQAADEAVDAPDDTQGGTVAPTA